jgi:hypothetical protein
MPVDRFPGPALSSGERLYPPDRSSGACDLSHVSYSTVYTLLPVDSPAQAGKWDGKNPPNEPAPTRADSPRDSPPLAKKGKFVFKLRVPLPEAACM